MPVVVVFSLFSSRRNETKVTKKKEAEKRLEYQLKEMLVERQHKGT